MKENLAFGNLFTVYARTQAFTMRYKYTYRANSIENALMYPI